MTTGLIVSATDGLTYFQAVVLGIIQGLTEFIPISSSGHLSLAPWIFGFTFLEENPEISRTFDVALHVGTFLALLIAVRHEIPPLARATVDVVRTRTTDTFEKRLVVYLAIATIPAGVIGFVGDDYITTYLDQPLIIAVTLMLFGMVMWSVDRRAAQIHDLAHVRQGDAWFIGLAQAFALVPGTSRSGITLTAGILRGFTREAAVRFSFLISLPIVGAAALYKTSQLLSEPLPPGIGWGQIAVGVAASFVTGYLAIEWLLRWLKTRTLLVFVVYRFVLGGIVLALVLSGARAPFT